jgi:cystathionine gamma-synthase
MTEQPITPGLESVAATYGVASDAAFGAIVPPLYLTSTYEFAGFEQPRSCDYGRFGNPTRDLLGDALAKLEGGAGSVITSSGMAALDLLLGQFRPSDLVLAPHDCYGGTMRLLKARAERGHLSVRFVDQRNEEAYAAALEHIPALVLIETPSNPLMRVVDIAMLSEKARGAGAQVAVDNTFLSPALQRPLTLGADYVVHSTTKYLNGHSDIVGGAVIAADPSRLAELRHWGNVVGSAGAPFDAWLTLRGLRTLFVRMERQQHNAMIIAERLERHPAVSRVYYPGLDAHPDRAVVARQQRGPGAMLSFDLAEGAAAVRQFLAGVQVFTLAESLGGIKSLVAHPVTMTHADMGEDARAVAGISDGLLRLSVGLEAAADLVAGLECGLAACHS